MNFKNSTRVGGMIECNAKLFSSSTFVCYPVKDNSSLFITFHGVK